MKDCLSTIAGLFLVLFFVVGIVLACGYASYVAAPYIPTPRPTRDPLDIYEEALSRCETRETLSDEECQAAALQEAYP